MNAEFLTFHFGFAVASFPQVHNFVVAAAPTAARRAVDKGFAFLGLFQGFEEFNCEHAAMR